MTSSLDRLQNVLRPRQRGPIVEDDQVESILADCWDQFTGSDQEGMSADKLLGRIEKVRWEPPILTFVIERHGGTVLGSTRADLHQWTINLDERTASCAGSGIRQLQPNAPRLDVRPIAREVTEKILNRREDERLKWLGDGSVRVLVGKVLPVGSAAKRTLGDRRKRLRKAIEEILEGAGWTTISANHFAPPGSSR